MGTPGRMNPAFVEKSHFQLVLKKTKNKTPHQRNHIQPNTELSCHGESPLRLLRVQKTRESIAIDHFHNSKKATVDSTRIYSDFLICEYIILE